MSVKTCGTGGTGTSNPSTSHKRSKGISGTGDRVLGVRPRCHGVCEPEYSWGNPATVVRLPNTHIPERERMGFYDLIEIYVQADVILREDTFTGAGRRPKRSIVGSRKAHLRKLRCPRIELAGQPER